MPRISCSRTKSGIAASVVENCLRTAPGRIAFSSLALAPIVSFILLCTRKEGTSLRAVVIEASLLLTFAIPIHGVFTKLPRSCGAWMVAASSLATISVPWYFLCLYAFHNHPAGMPTLFRFELSPFVLVPAALLECVDSCRLRARQFETGSFKHRYLEWISRF